MMIEMIVIVMILPGLIQGDLSTVHDDFLIEILGSVKKRNNTVIDAKPLQFFSVADV